MASANQSEKTRIVLLGKTGVGKSATGNTILGGPSFKSKTSATSVTSVCRVESNSLVRVIDTPGFFDTSMSNKTIRNEVVKCIAMSTPGPHAFIFVVKPGRFTQIEIDTINLIKKTFGQEVMTYMIVLFVGKDNLDEDGTTIEEYLETVPDNLRKVLEDCDNKYIFFNNHAGDEDKRQQTRALIDRVQNIVERNGGCYSHDMYVLAEKILLAEENKLKQELEEKNNKEIKAVKKRMLQENPSKEIEFQDRITQLELELAKQKEAARENIVRDVMNRSNYAASLEAALLRACTIL